MKVKRYFAHNMRSALEMVKKEQGPDVLILSNRKVDGGVELTTADELSEQDMQRLVAPQTKARRTELAAAADAAASPAAGRAAQAAPAAAISVAQAAPVARRATALGVDGDARELLWTDAGTVEQMREELRNLKGLLETQLSGLAWSDFGTRHPLRARLLRVLTRVGLCPALARALVAEVPDDLDYRAGWHRALALLVLRMATLDNPVLREGGRIALLGPTGVGKTTVASKLAARQALKFGSDTVALVSMDDRRLGAHQQLKAFGRLIGVPVFVARDIEELGTVLEDVSERTLVLIDTPGNAPDDVRYRELALGLGQLPQDLQAYNVCSATTDYLAATKLFKVTTDLPLAGCILTKIDEAATLGPILSAIIESGLPLAYTSAGQRVPDDIEPANARRLVERTVDLAKALPVPQDRSIFERAFLA